VHHVAINLPDEAEAFCLGQKIGRHDHFDRILTTLHPHQQLLLHDLAAAQVGDHPLGLPK